MTRVLYLGPDHEPCSVQDLRDHLRLDDDADDVYLGRLAAVVRHRAERATRRALVTQTWDVYLDEWPTAVDGVLPHIRLPKPPLQTVTDVHYVDLAGVTQLWASTEYVVDVPTGPYADRGRLALAWTKVWPIIQPRVSAVKVRQVCGYGLAKDVPELIVQAMLLDAGTLFEIRASVLSGARAAAIEVPSTSKDIYLSFRAL